MSDGRESIAMPSVTSAGTARGRLAARPAFLTRRAALALLCLIGLAPAGAAFAAAPAQGGASDAALVTRTFTVNYRPVDEVVALIQPVVSDRGSYAVQPRIKSVTVTDTADRLDRIRDLIAGFDLPPRSINLVIQIMRAVEGAPPGGAKPPARRMGLPPSVIQDLTKWGVITQIGNASLPTAENESGSVALGESPDDYRVSFRMGAVTPSLGVIRMERFVLERARRAAPAAGAGGGDGTAPPQYVTLMDLVLNLKDRQTTVLGATSSQDSKQALFVSVTATSSER